MADVMMKCGCRTNATFKNKPCCAVHFCEEVAKSQPDLKGRKAKCAYGNHGIVDSSLSLAFFEYLGPGSPSATDTCKHCRMYKEAHVHDPKRVDPTSVVEKGKCPGFEPRGGQEMDRYYCGCKGWD